MGWYSHKMVVAPPITVKISDTTVELLAISPGSSPNQGPKETTPRPRTNMIKGRIFSDMNKIKSMEMHMC